MEESLRIDDGDDHLDLQRDLEAIFAMRFTNEEAENCRTAGDILQVVRSRFPCDGEGGCSTAMAFYRLRRGLSAAGVRARPAPGTRLDKLDGWAPRQVIELLQANAGLKVPAVWKWTSVGWAGIWAVVAGVCCLMPALHYGGIVLGAACALVCVAGVALTRKDPGRLPAGSRTLGDLARRVSHLNVGVLHGQGAKVRESDLWGGLVEALSPYTTVPRAAIQPGSAITRG